MTFSQVGYKCKSPKVLFLLECSVGSMIVLNYGLHFLNDAAALRGVILSAPIMGQTGMSPIKMAMR